MRKVIRKRIRYDKDGVQIDGDVNVVIAASVSGEKAEAETSTQRISVRRRASRHAREDARDPAAPDREGGDDV